MWPTLLLTPSVQLCPGVFDAKAAMIETNNVLRLLFLLCCGQLISKAIILVPKGFFLYVLSAISLQEFACHLCVLILRLLIISPAKMHSVTELEKH